MDQLVGISLIGGLVIFVAVGVLTENYLIQLLGSVTATALVIVPWLLVGGGTEMQTPVMIIMVNILAIFALLLIARRWPSSRKKARANTRDERLQVAAQALAVRDMRAADAGEVAASDAEVTAHISKFVGDPDQLTDHQWNIFDEAYSDSFMEYSQRQDRLATQLESARSLRESRMRARKKQREATEDTRAQLNKSPEERWREDWAQAQEQHERMKPQQKVRTAKAWQGRRA